MAVIGAQWTDIWRQRRLDGSADAVGAGSCRAPARAAGHPRPGRRCRDAESRRAAGDARRAGRQASGDCRNRHVHRRFVPAHFEIERRAPKVHRESSPENKDALRQRRITELQDGIRAAAEAGEWQTVLNLASELSSSGTAQRRPRGTGDDRTARLAERAAADSEP